MRFCLAAFATAISSIAAAETAALPDYHLDAKCEAQSKSISGKASGGIAKECEESERAAYDNLNTYWPRLDEAQKVKCLAAASGPKLGNYKILQQCLNREELRVDGKLQGDPKGGQH